MQQHAQSVLVHRSKAGSYQPIKYNIKPTLNRLQKWFFTWLLSKFSVESYIETYSKSVESINVIGLLDKVFAAHQNLLQHFEGSSDVLLVGHDEYEKLMCVELPAQASYSVPYNDFFKYSVPVIDDDYGRQTISRQLIDKVGYVQIVLVPWMSGVVLLPKGFNYFSHTP